MSATPGDVPVKSIMPKWVRGPQDFVGGIALMVIALFALWASSDLQGMRGFSFGAGTAPRMFGFLLLALFMVVTGFALYGEGAQMGSWQERMFGWVIPLTSAAGPRAVASTTTRSSRPDTGSTPNMTPPTGAGSMGCTRTARGWSADTEALARAAPSRDATTRRTA